ncbi:hypothetical protein [Escherichia coli]|uniref:hypothetical protein n=1 Tax=Escherichia coli TaxID=562 RepID=UPI00191914DF|nr:hypothetical protein [Escherichia coli]CAD5672548.1 Uncharacterised protein [Escherichia coli]
MSSLYGWQIMDATGKVIADTSAIMCRRLFSYEVPVIEALASNIPWSVSFGVNFNNGTPFAHCVTRAGLRIPAGRVWYPVAPDIIINGNSVTLTYTARHVSYPDDLGYLLAVGGVDVHCGVYHR